MGQGIYNGIWWPDLEGGFTPPVGNIIQENGFHIMSENNEHLIIE
jgi:hypothetical protein